jgi:hypothetical protein
MNDLRRARRIGLAVMTAMMLGVPAAGAIGAPVVASTSTPVASAEVSGPVSGPGPGQTTVDGIIDLAGAGYVEQEYFVEGTATSYRQVGVWGSDGNWTAAPATDDAAYKTRIIVRRPSDPKRFNGTVVVEWMNVTGQADSTPDFFQMQAEALRGGYAWVGVSAQFVGVQGSFFALKNWNPARYGSLVHPGDSYSYDIFSQVGQALREPSGVDPLGDLRPGVERLIADGESQSAQRLVTYINAVHPLVGVFDGFLVHSRSAGGSPLSQAPLALAPVPGIVRIRTDLTTPVFIVQNETDLVLFRTTLARQPDTDTIRTWELAGTAHFDQNGLDFAFQTAGRDFPGFSLIPQCVLPANSAHARYVYDAALQHLDSWAKAAEAPPIGLPVTLNTDGSIARDGYGNALGGVRLPELDVPTATQSGVGNNSVSPPNFCVLFGVSAAFPAATVNTLYPSHGRYVSQYTRAVQQARQAGFILPYDATEAITGAAASTVGK